MQNFGKIKNVFNILTIEGIVKKDEKIKKLFKKYIKTLNESKILKTQFLVYNNIENSIQEDFTTANLFLYENLALLKKYDSKLIEKENEKLISILGEYKNKIEENYDLSDLHESITKLIFIKRTPKNINLVTENTKKITSYLQTDKKKVIDEITLLPNSLISNLMIERYNEKYSTLNEEEKNVLNVLMAPNFETKKIFYNDVVTECNNLVDSLLKNSDDESKDKLEKVKVKLSENIDNLNENDFISRLSKIIELKNELKNN